MSKSFFCDLNMFMSMNNNRNLLGSFFPLVSSVKFIYELHFLWQRLQYVRRYSSQLNCSSEVFILMENIRANGWMSFCVTGCFTNHYTFLCVIAVMHLHDYAFKGAVLYVSLFLLYPLSITTSYPSLHLPLSPPLSPVEMLTGAGGAALLINPVGLTALSQAVMVTHRCSTHSNTAAKDGKSLRSNYPTKHPGSRVSRGKPLKHYCSHTEAEK